MKNERRTFILGLGHQKCGTSWLHKYLCQSEAFARGYVKEYHVWDRVDLPLFANKLKSLNLHTILSPKRLRSYRMENSEKYYFSYFDDLMKMTKVLTADITPSYSGLKAERLVRIKEKFSQRDIEVKAVILVREPLSRIKSAVRFNLDRKNYSEGIDLNETDFEKALLQYFKTDHCILRTQYENIIREASAVFAAENIYIGFYESMFEESEVRRISDFLQIKANFEFAKVRVNKTRNSVHETASDSMIKEFYVDTYNYFYQNFPDTKLLWA